MADEFAADVFAGLMSQLEAIGDEFERLANTREQADLAQAFNELVSDLPRLLRIAAKHETQQERVNSVFHRGRTH